MAWQSLCRLCAINCNNPAPNHRGAAPYPFVLELCRFVKIRICELRFLLPICEMRDCESENNSFFTSFPIPFRSQFQFQFHITCWKLLRNRKHDSLWIGSGIDLFRSFLPAAAGLHLAIFCVIFFSGRVLEGLSIFCQRVSKSQNSQNIYCLKEFVNRFSLNMSQIKEDDVIPTFISWSWEIAVWNWKKSGRYLNLQSTSYQKSQNSKKYLLTTF